MPNYVTSIDDQRFDEHLSLRDAYRTMCEFLVAYHNRGESSTVDLLTDTTVLPDGGSADPAQLQDFIDAFARVRST